MFYDWEIRKSEIKTKTFEALISAPISVLWPKPYPSSLDIHHPDCQHILHLLGGIFSQHGVPKRKLANRPSNNRICKWKGCHTSTREKFEYRKSRVA